MGWQEYYREHLAEELDEHGDIVPPWAKYPDFERHTIGWRMGAGEGWLCFFFGVSRDSAARLRDAFGVSAASSSRAALVGQ